MTPIETLNVLEKYIDRSSNETASVNIDVLRSLIADARTLHTIAEKCQYYSTFPYDNAVKVLSKELLNIIEPPPNTQAHGPQL